VAIGRRTVPRPAPAAGRPETVPAPATAAS
jgi:hypothetical protein